jgi:hypothetical protein
MTPWWAERRDSDSSYLRVLALLLFLGNGGHKTMVRDVLVCFVFVPRQADVELAAWPTFAALLNV